MILKLQLLERSSNAYYVVFLQPGAPENFLKMLVITGEFTSAAIGMDMVLDNHGPSRRGPSC